MSRGAELFQRALLKCYNQDTVDRGEVVQGIREGDKLLHSNFRYYLAGELADEIHIYLPQAGAVYLYGSTAVDQAGPSSDLDLMVLVEDKGGPFPPALKKVDLFLVTAYQIYFQLEQVKLERLLDISLIDGIDLKQRRGPAALIGSVFVPALKIWPNQSL